jgi:hypothetical protein
MAFAAFYWAVKRVVRVALSRLIGTVTPPLPSQETVERCTSVGSLTIARACVTRGSKTVAIRFLPLARKFALAVPRQSENAAASSWRASPVLLRSRHQQSLMPNGICVSVVGVVWEP